MDDAQNLNLSRLHAINRKPAVESSLVPVHTNTIVLRGRYSASDETGGFVEKQSRNGVAGLILIGLGAGFTAAGLALVVPVCATWSRSRLRDAYQKGKESVTSTFESAADALGSVATKAQHPMADAAKAARQTTAIAAGAIESAAHYIKERVQ
jgi:hypothetical protein